MPGHRFRNTYNQNLRVVPQRGRDNDLDLLSTRQTLNFIVLGDITVETDILQVLSDEVCGVVTRTGTFSGRLHVIELTQKLAEAELQQFFSADPGVVSVVEALELDFVLE